MFLDIAVSGFETDIGQIERHFLVFAELIPLWKDVLPRQVTEEVLLSNA